MLVYLRFTIVSSTVFYPKQVRFSRGPCWGPILLGVVQTGSLYSTGYKVVPMSDRYRDWCWTFNNVEDSKELQGWLEFLKEESRYTVGQPETAPTTGRIHIQGYSEFSKPIRINALKAISKSVHLEKRKGTREQARDYCLKEESAAGDWFEFGEWKESGKSDVWNDMFKDIDAGATLNEVARDHGKTFARYYKGIAKTIELRQSRSHDVVINYIKPEEAKLFKSKGYRKVYYQGGRFYGTQEGCLKYILDPKGIPDSLLEEMLESGGVSVPVPYGEREWCPSHICVLEHPGGGNTKAPPEPSVKERDPIRRVLQDARSKIVLED